MKNKVNILGINIDPLTTSEANSRIADLVKSSKSKSHYVVKPYVEFIERSKKDKNIAKILNDADLVLADGVSLQWAASYLYSEPKKKLLKLPRSLVFWIQNPKWRNKILPEKMAGASQTLPLLKIAAREGWRVGILGGNDPKSTSLGIKKVLPGLNNLYVWNGYFSSADEAEILSSIKSEKLDLLFVAMGFPRQERFIYKNLDKHLAKVLIGEGGTFDYHSLGGKIRRAPEWIQKIGLEWLYRLIRQPKRILRQLAIPRFIIEVYKQGKKL